ncbi:MAG: chorismate-binding protein [Candidatus Nanopelagicales bacterium]
MATTAEPAAVLGGQVASGLLEVTDDLRALDDGGRWAVAVPYSGPPVLARFADWRLGSPGDVAGPWRGPDAWSSSLSRSAYIAAVEFVRARIAEGGVYQANVCRVLEATLPEADAMDIAGLYALLSDGNPAPHGGMLRLPDQDVHIASASPELFLRRDGSILESGPIKGTGRIADDLTAKDEAENIMIVDLVRNDLSRVCDRVSVPALLALESHPGLVHLVSTVAGELREGVGWPAILEATFPPGSVTGAPKIAALRHIEAVESAEREFYCGAFGWVDADAGTASLAVAIRTFWREGDTLRFGTGAGITWGSDAEAEWSETELKAARLIDLAGRTWGLPG